LGESVLKYSFFFQFLTAWIISRLSQRDDYNKLVKMSVRLSVRLYKYCSVHAVSPFSKSYSAVATGMMATTLGQLLGSRILNFGAPPTTWPLSATLYTVLSSCREAGRSQQTCCAIFYVRKISAKNLTPGNSPHHARQQARLREMN